MLLTARLNANDVSSDEFQVLLFLENDSSTLRHIARSIIHTGTTMVFRLIALALVAFLFVGCTKSEREFAETKDNPQPDELFVDGSEFVITGKAVTLPDHANKANSQGVSTAKGDFLFSGSYSLCPKQLLGSKILVKGIIRKKRLPMFESDNDGSPVPQGIPVPHGTDIEKESVYYVIENPVWELTTDSK